MYQPPLSSSPFSFVPFHISVLFLPFCVSCPPMFTLSVPLFYLSSFPRLLSSPISIFLYTFLLYPFCLISLILSTLYLFSPILPSFTLYTSHSPSPSLQLTTAINTQVYKSNMKHLPVWRNIRPPSAYHKATNRAPSCPETRANWRTDIWICNC